MPSSLCMIVVQSSGKSSVLEAVVGVDFLPRGAGAAEISASFGFRQPHNVYCIFALWNHRYFSEASCFLCGTGIVTRRPLVLQLVRVQDPAARAFGEFLHAGPHQFWSFGRTARLLSQLK